MTTAIESDKVLSEEDQVLEYTQAKRKSLIEALMPQNAVPSDRGDKAILLQALNDMDKPALVKLRIKSEEKNGASNALAAAAIAQMLAQVAPKKIIDHDPSVVPPTLKTEELPKFQYVEGQMDIGTQSGSYEEFMRTHGTDVDEKAA